ncbi:MAG: TIGR02281 family clan AA aspartic protease, partial [Alphaproteobacteria bacterium]
TSRSTTANGVARVAPVTLDSLRIGSIMLREVRAVVAEPGKMTQNLLGMSFISRLSNFELKGGTLVMIQNDAQ